MLWTTLFATLLALQYTKSDPLTKTENSNLLSTCGKFSQTKVFGGREAERSEAPWSVFLVTMGHDNTNTVCTGTVVSSRHILTATHCFAAFDPSKGWNGLTYGPMDAASCKDGNYYITDPSVLSNVWIMLNKNDKITEYPERITLVNACLKKSFEPGNAKIANEDFAIIDLYDDLTFSAEIQPVCVSMSLDDHKTGTAMDYYGFGLKRQFFFYWH
uniref:Peptidase S1 domain-containing protein n=1 Tax=Caenorhabditis japonica TaxID=281687 RepID=A0A8R1HMQ6_CAEJA